MAKYVASADREEKTMDESPFAEWMNEWKAEEYGDSFTCDFQASHFFRFLEAKRKDAFSSANNRQNR